MENYFISILVFLIIEIPVFTLFPAKNSKKNVVVGKCYTLFIDFYMKLKEAVD